MLTLITYPGGFGQASLSPFCVKAAYLLQLSGHAWQRQDQLDPRKAPRGKLPLLRTPHGLIHESDAIRAYLEEHGADFDAGLSAAERAQSRAIQRMAEEHMYFILVLDRWEREDVWPTIRDAYFGEIPSLLRHLITRGIRRTLLSGLAAQGLGRMSWDERMARLDQDLDAIRALLGSRDYLFGDRPTTADTSVGAVLGAMRATPVATPVQGRILQDDRLTAYIDRVDAILDASL